MILPGLTDGTTTDSATTTAASTTASSSCYHNGRVVSDGDNVESDDPCQHCYCMGGDIVCAVDSCIERLQGESDDCVPNEPPPGQCCPTSFTCSSTDSPADGQGDEQDQDDDSQENEQVQDDDGQENEQDQDGDGQESEQDQDDDGQGNEQDQDDDRGDEEEGDGAKEEQTVDQPSSAAEEDDKTDGGVEEQVQEESEEANFPEGQRPCDVHGHVYVHGQDIPGSTPCKKCNCLDGQVKMNPIWPIETFFMIFVYI